MTQAENNLAREDAAFWCSFLAEGPLTEEDREAFEGWLEESAEHRALFNQAVSVWRALPLPIEILEPAAEAPPPWRILPVRARGGVRPYASIFLGLVMLAVLGATGIYLAAAPKAFVSGVAQTQTIALNDGSLLLLDASSKVRVQFTGHERRVWLDRGRAEFRVKHDARRPFSVVSDNHTVVALGTQFTVERQGNGITVDLVQGRLAGFNADTKFRVAVAHSRLIAGADYVFTGGQRLRWQNDSEQAALSTVSKESATAWTSGRLVFVDEPLQDAVETVNRYATEPVKIGSGVQSQVRISGIYRAGDVKAFVLGVSATSNLSVRKSQHGWTLDARE